METVIQIVNRSTLKCTDVQVSKYSLHSIFTKWGNYLAAIMYVLTEELPELQLMIYLFYHQLDELQWIPRPMGMKSILTLKSIV